MEEQTKSNMEIALEFIDEHPTLADAIQGDAFAVFWEYPEKVIALFNKTLEFLSNAHQIPEEVVDTMKPDLMNEACESYLNLMAKEAESS